jgi:spermidine synthase
VACFLVSGAAGLLYEVVWSKQLSYLMGNSLHAVATVVAAFLTGLAIGAYLLGARLARRREGVRVYALLELGIGVLGLVSMPALRALDPLIGALYRGMGGETQILMLVRFLLLFLVLLPPTIQMGATLPVLVAHFEYRSVGPALARLYAVNTAGAVLGSVLGGFVLLPTAGLSATTWVAASLNFVAAALAWRAAAASKAAFADRAPTTAKTSAEAADTGAPRAPVKGEPAPPLLAPRARVTLAVLFATSGLAALAFQIAWVRLFGLLFGSSVYSFSAVLAVYLAGLAAGSALVAPWLRDATRGNAAARLLVRLGGVQLALAIVTLASVRAFPLLPESFYSIATRAHGDWRALYVGELGLVALVLLLPCIGFGAAFPLAARLLQTRDGGHATGFAYAVNTVGTLAGSLLAGFALVPALGVQGTHLAAAILTGLAGVATLGLGVSIGLPRRATAIAGGAAIAACALLAVVAPRWDPALMSAGIYRPAVARQVGSTAPGARSPVWSASRNEQVLFYREGLNGSVYVATDSTGTRWLKVGGKTDASTNDMLTQVLLGVLPGSIARPGASVAVIGLGSGITLASALATGAGAVEVLEIEPAVVEASKFFDEPGRAPLADPRVKLVLGDARTRMFHAREQWDAIVSEPSNPWIAGVNNLFTVDFYRRLRERLRPAGVFCQWIQIYELSPETLRTLLRSYLEVFPTGHAFLSWDTQDLLLVSMPKGASLPLARLRQGEVVHQLARARQLGPESIAAWYACPFDSLRAVAAGAPLNRDDLPVIEYRAARDLYRVGEQAQMGPGLAMIPSVSWASARALFADWPAQIWLAGRARQLARSGVDAIAAETIRDAAAEGFPDLARELDRFAAAERGRRDAVRERNAARAEMAAGRMAAARDALLRAAALDSTEGQTWVMLAQIEQGLGEERGSLAALARARAVGDSPVRGYARMLEGSIETQKGRLPEAAAALAEVPRWLPRDERSWLAAAQSSVAAGDTVAALGFCRRGLDVLPGATQLRAMLSTLAR